MSRIVATLSLGCLAAIGFTAFGMLRGDHTERIPIPDCRGGSDELDAGNGDLARELDAARRSCRRENLDAVVARLRRQVEARSQDRDSWRLLAEGLLDRALQRGHLIGMQPGRPVYDRLPDEVAADIDAAAAAVLRAQELGDDSADVFRISAEVMGQRITGLGSALQWNGRIEEAIAKAGERAQDDPRLHLVIGLRKLMAPELLGHDPDKALEHFSYAAETLPNDERPALFAAMASYLKQKRLDAIGWLERAVARNPSNVFAQVVLHRLRRGEDDPFGRTVTAAEAAADAPRGGK
ncbi:MAG: hypothetical protein KDC98_15570 [Planctomycetes bacterium]|nr:hypothetical protein [Planctomycetota bacterium]